jgi:hypothetical protein
MTRHAVLSNVALLCTDLSFHRVVCMLAFIRNVIDRTLVEEFESSVLASYSMRFWGSQEFCGCVWTEAVDS